MCLVLCYCCTYYTQCPLQCPLLSFISFIIYCREEGDLFLEWDVDDFPLDTDDSESQGRATPVDSISVDNITAAMATSSKSRQSIYCIYYTQSLTLL